MSSRRKSEPFRSLPNSENLYGRLVDGFLRITDWPTGRKVALVTGILIPYHIGYLTTARSFLGGPEGTVDLDLVEPLLWVWLGVIVTTFLLSLRRPAWSGSERLPLYFLIFGYGTLIFGFVYLFGTMSTAYISYYIVAILVVLILFDGWAGALAAGFGTFLLIAIGVGEIVGLLPFAPALAKRAIDDQNTFAWFATTFVWILMAVLILCFLLQLTTAARERAREAIQRSSEIVRRYVPPEVATRIMDGRDAEILRTQRRRLTIFFSDIEGFTALADRIEPEIVSSILNEYLAEMSMIAARHHGTLNEFIGDGVMILFGAPEESSPEDQASRAVGMAAAMQLRMEGLNQRWLHEGLDVPLRVRMGINTGVVSVGSFGSAGRMTYTAIGHQTNVAARIQAHCEPGRILLGESTWRLVKSQVGSTPRGEISFKGVHTPVRVYEVSLEGST